MANLIKVLPSGVELEVQLASFEEAERLRKAVMRELQDVDINLGDTNKLKNVLEQELTSDSLNTIKNLLLKLFSAQSIEEALWPCMGRCIYKNRKITKDLFEPLEARGDYLLVVKEVMVYNLAPFFASVGSLSSKLSALVNTVTPKQG